MGVGADESRAESTESPAEVTDDEVVQGESTAPVVGTIEVDNGAHVTIEAGPEGPISMVIAGDEAAVRATADKLKLAKDIAAVYSTLAPDLSVPEAVTAAAARIARETLAAAPTVELAGGDLGTGDIDAELEAAQGEQQIEFDEATAELTEVQAAAADALAVVNKEAPRDVNGFLNNFCAVDQINEASAARSYARKVQTCQTEKTGNHTQTMNGVVQGVGGARSYRGTIDLVWYWKNGSTWTKGGTNTIAENTWAIRWVYGNPTNDLRFAIENATNDGWHLFVHKADSNFSDQKTLAGNDYYHQVCNCTDVYGVTATTIIEGCQSNQAVYDNNVTGLCQAYALFDQTAHALQITRCLPLNTGTHERVSWGRNCSNAAGQDYKDCYLLDECVFECQDICR